MGRHQQPEPILQKKSPNHLNPSCKFENQQSARGTCNHQDSRQNALLRPLPTCGCPEDSGPAQQRVQQPAGDRGDYPCVEPPTKNTRAGVLQRTRRRCVPASTSLRTSSYGTPGPRRVALSGLVQFESPEIAAESRDSRGVRLPRPPPEPSKVEFGVEEPRFEAAASVLSVEAGDVTAIGAVCARLDVFAGVAGLKEGPEFVAPASKSISSLIRPRCWRTGTRPRALGFSAILANRSRNTCRDASRKA